MNIQFRTRIGEKVDYKELLNYGLCCRGITAIGTTGEHDYVSCYNAGGVFIPYSGNIITETSPDNQYLNIPKCPNPFSTG